MDPITLKRIETAHPALRAELHQIYSEICQRLTGRSFCRFTQVLRTFDEQNALYAQGRTAPGSKVTNARGGQSYHNYGMAVDICLIIDGKTASWEVGEDWMKCVDVFRSYGWEWGGDWTSFKDYPHFQKDLAGDIACLQTRVKQGLVDEDGYVLV